MSASSCWLTPKGRDVCLPDTSLCDFNLLCQNVRQTSLSSMLNYLVASIFIAMSIALLWSGPQNWSLIPFLILMSVLFIKKKGKKEFWKLGENLIFPLLCFSFVVTFIQTLVTGGDSSALWFNGVFAVGAAFGSFYNFVVKPKKDSF